MFIPQQTHFQIPTNKKTFKIPILEECDLCFKSKIAFQIAVGHGYSTYPALTYTPLEIRV